jgi:uncharacterized protein (TIGR00661 family)
MSYNTTNQDEPLPPGRFGNRNPRELVMRIIYGVHGYGRGHATRTLAILPELSRRHQVLILAGGDAYAAIRPDYEVQRIPTLAFAYGPGTGNRSNFHTFRRNASAFLDLKFRGPSFEMVQNIMEEFSPDIVISDADGWTHSVAQYLRIPRISVDHIGIMEYCKPKIDWRDQLEAKFDRIIYRMFMGRPERIIVSSFYDAPPRRPGVRVVPTLVRSAVHDLTPTDGEHLLVYFNRGKDQFNKRIYKTLHEVGCPVRIYGGNREGRDGNLTFLPPSNLPFLEDLASCRGVISTAGNQLMGETIYLGKPVLVIPERCVEQRLNASGVVRLGIGMRTTRGRFKPKLIREFLNRTDEFRANMKDHVRDGLQETLDALEQFMSELAPGGAPASDVSRDTKVPVNGKARVQQATV